MLNFKMSELIHSDTASRLNINNMPDINSLDNMLVLICECLQPIRERLGMPMIISSGFRSSSLNSKINGSKTSQHCKGQAADFTVKGLTVTETINRIRKMGIKFTQLIDEENGSQKWVHIGYDKNNLKCECLKYRNGIYSKLQ